MEAEYVPAAQAEQAVEPAAFANVPEGQAEQEVAFAAPENVPGPHDTGEPVGDGQYCPGEAVQGPATVTGQEVEPVAVFVVPSGQVVQEDCPACAAKVPTPQAEQDAEPYPEEMLPEGQEVQELAAAVELKKPGEQEIGVVVPGAQYWPGCAVQTGGVVTSQVAEPMLLVVVPAGQALQELAPPDAW